MGVYGGTTKSWNSLQIQNNANFFASGGTVTEITQNGIVYRVHSFTTVGVSTLTVNRQLKNLEYLIVAGGGGTGEFCGGAGSGGLLTGNVAVITPQNYTITVGDGGIRSPSGITGSTNGSNSSAFGETSLGGGRGQSTNISSTGFSGGSGGGNGPRGGSGGLGTTGQGNNGGGGRPGETGNNGGSGAGGGAGASGESGSFRQGGNGGIGIESNITGISTFYAGGGGGFGDARNGASIRGLGGLGGGGISATGSSGTNDAESGVPNSGGGAGAGGPSAATGGRDGGSGIVIIRYPIGVVGQ
jgi:hypothetical protein